MIINLKSMYIIFNAQEMPGRFSDSDSLVQVTVIVGVTCDSELVTQ